MGCNESKTVVPLEFNQSVAINEIDPCCKTFTVHFVYTTNKEKALDYLTFIDMFPEKFEHRYEYPGSSFPLTAEVVLTDNGKPDDRDLVHVTADGIIFKVYDGTVQSIINGNNVLEYNPDGSPIIRKEIKRVPADPEICGNVYALISD